jgi:dTDP-4-dehydrorhamnose reductase
VRVLVTGAAGQVGQALRALAPAGAVVTALTHTELDITEPGHVRAAVTSSRPEWIVNAAAYTAVDAAENHREAALALNATAVGSLAEAARTVGARLVQLSTDFVFDGRRATPYTPEDETAPLNVYGASKLAGERLALLDAPESLVLRTSWVYAAQGKNFVRTILTLMSTRPELRVVCDQVGSPTWALGLARALWRLIELAAAPGLYHWCDAGVASWYDFAVAIQEEALERRLLERAVPILPIRSAEFPTPACRPPYSALDASGTRAVTGLPAIHWRAQLRSMLDELTRP